MGPKLIRYVRPRAVEVSATDSAPANPMVSSDDSARGRNTIHFFFEQKEDGFETVSLDINRRMDALKEELKKAQQETLNEIIDFLALLAGGADSAEAREVIRGYGGFVCKLGSSESEIIRVVKRRG